jgi:preprotein translocase subunit SecG
MLIVLRILHIIFTVSLILFVLFQSGKQAGLSGSIAGGAETFFGKNKGRTIDALLSKYTTFVAIAFLITSVLLSIVISRMV